MVWMLVLVGVLLTSCSRSQPSYVCLSRQEEAFLAMGLLPEASLPLHGALNIRLESRTGCTPNRSRFQ